MLWFVIIIKKIISVCKHLVVQSFRKKKPCVSVMDSQGLLKVAGKLIKN